MAQQIRLYSNKTLYLKVKRRIRRNSVRSWRWFLQNKKAVQRRRWSNNKFSLPLLNAIQEEETILLQHTYASARALWCWRLWTWGYYANLLSRLSRILMYTEKVASVGGLPSPPLGHFICLPPVYLARILSTFPCLSLCIRICICFSNSLSLIQRLCFSFSPSSSLVSPSLPPLYSSLNTFFVSYYYSFGLFHLCLYFYFLRLLSYLLRGFSVAYIIFFTIRPLSV